MKEELKQATGASEAGAMEEKANPGQGTPAGTEPGQAQGKLFTQDEVNGFIQARLGQMKKQASKENGTEYDQKLKELEARETKLLVREKLSEKGMPQELADIISCTGEDDIEQKLDRLNEIYGRKKEDKEDSPKGFQIGSGGANSMYNQPDPVRGAFGLNR